MAKSELKIQARALRLQGKRIKEIANELGVSKGSVSIWCDDIVLTPEQKFVIEQNMRMIGRPGSLKGAAANKKKKQDSIEEAKKWAQLVFSTFPNRDLLIAGISLYWAEGSKADRTEFLFVNSDPNMVKFMKNWFVLVLGIDKQDITAQIHINEMHKERIDVVIMFWSKLLSIEQFNFKKTFFKKTIQKKVYENHENYFGILRLGVRRSRVLKYRMLALIEELKNADVAHLVRADVS